MRTQGSHKRGRQPVQADAPRPSHLAAHRAPPWDPEKGAPPPSTSPCHWRLLLSPTTGESDPGGRRCHSPGSLCSRPTPPHEHPPARCLRPLPCGSLFQQSLPPQENSKQRGFGTCFPHPPQAASNKCSADTRRMKGLFKPYDDSVYHLWTRLARQCDLPKVTRLGVASRVETGALGAPTPLSTAPPAPGRLGHPAHVACRTPAL